MPPPEVRPRWKRMPGEKPALRRRIRTGWLLLPGLTHFPVPRGPPVPGRARTPARVPGRPRFPPLARPQAREPARRPRGSAGPGQAQRLPRDHWLPRRRRRLACRGGGWAGAVERPAAPGGASHRPGGKPPGSRRYPPGSPYAPRGDGRPFHGPIPPPAPQPPARRPGPSWLRCPG